MYSVSKDNLISLKNVRNSFLKYNKSFNEMNVGSLNQKFKEWAEQKLYLVFEDDKGNKHLFLASKRGNYKFKNKLRIKVKNHEEYIKKIFKSNRPFSNCLFITLTFNREFYINNISCWINLTDLVNDYISNLNKKLKKINNGMIYFFKTYELHEDFFPHVHILAIFKKQFRCFYYNGKWRIYKKRLFEWKKGFVDVEAIMKQSKALSYLVKYSIKEIENESNIKLKLSNKQYILCILWLLRKFTVSHTRITRLDSFKSELTYFNPYKKLNFIGLVILELYQNEEEYFKENYWKILYLVYYPDLKKAELNSKDWEFITLSFDEDHIFQKAFK